MEEVRKIKEGKITFTKEWWNTRADKNSVIAIGLLHLFCIFAFIPQLFSWSGLLICVILMWVSGGLGVTLCFHRLLTHASFKTTDWLKKILVICGCLSWQGSPLQWVAVHRYHHQYSDQELDPHSPRDGFDWSHLLWMFTKIPPSFKGYELVKDLRRDSFLQKIDKLFWVPQIILALILFGAGLITGDYLLGLSWVVWGIGVRTVLVFHTTWFVNSAAHTWGYQNYTKTGDDSRNLWWVALLSFGEGWHNNHHAVPRSARHGMRWFEIDVTYMTILLLSFLGLVWDVKCPQKKME